ncbi:double-stranded RNA-binding protein Staufen homolog 2-like isoform X2 [Apostichopus japonicus]|uniref:double-stranded RNA-binding protein Staufen homolog 2-like isoform X2 n=1 Tax=Stichopus japonicus TaxID=307972 RepID=UPI003AB76765
MANNQPSANPSTGETKPSPAQQPGILPISVEMIALQTTEECKEGNLAAVQSKGSGDAGGAIKEASAPGAAQQEGMANSKESTPMGLLNSVARYNNMKPNYELIQEEGPAHQKMFSVQLTFGDEKYKGTGTSIKRAQHDAAQKALDSCKLPTPERKEKPTGYKLLRSPNKNALTPTVQLNSYSLKTGVTVDYAVLNSYPSYPPGGFRRPPYQQHRYSNSTTAPPPTQGGGGGDSRPKEQDGNVVNTFHGEPRQGNPVPFPGPPAGGGVGPRPRGPRGPGQHHYNYMHYSPYEMRPMYRQRYRRPYPQVFNVKLTVGNREFVGQGANQRLARQDAAGKAMKSIEESPIPVKKDQATSMLEEEKKETATSASGDAPNNNKSEISQVYEVANFNGLNLEFKVLDESGPPHQKEYKIQCTVGNITVVETGTSKKESKRKAAAAVLPKLKSLPPPVKTVRQGPRMGWKPAYKRSTIQKKSADDSDFGAVGMNPISRLVQICQAKKMKDPFFEVLNDQPIPDRRVHPTIYRHIFTMKVSVGEQSAEGKGSTKKEAKKEAAEGMLVLMGYKPSNPDTPIPIPGADATPGKPALKQPQENREVKKQEEEAQNNDRKVTFQDDQVKGLTVKKEEEVEKPELVPGSQQGPQIPGITPGLFPMMPGIKPIQHPFPQQPPVQQPPTQALNRAPGAPVSTPLSAPRKTFNPALTADIASELLLTQRSMTAQTILQSSNLPIKLQTSRPQHMLEYMGAVTGLDVAFNDYPQSTQNEFLTEVRISTEPPVVFHGTAQTMDAAHDLASLNVLRALAGCPPEEANRVVAQNRSMVQGIGINSQ